MIHGITNNRVWILLGAAAPFYDNAFGYLSEWLAEKGLQLNQLVGEQTIAWWQFGLYAFVMLMMAMALVAVISIGGALFTFYDYTLSRHNDRYIRRSGLLNKQEVSMRASRIQVISENLFKEIDTLQTRSHSPNDTKFFDEDGKDVLPKIQQQMESHKIRTNLVVD